MKNLLAVVLTLSFSCFCYAQNSPISKNEEVSVIYAGFESGGDNQGLQKTYSELPFIQTSNNSSNVAPPPPDTPKSSRQIESIKFGLTQSRTRVSFKNNTQKKITSIGYDFIVYNVDGKELKRYALLNNSDIKANKIAELSDVIGGLHTNRSLAFKAVITRVNYKGGSVWIP
jgi:hypothetical protein